MFVKDLHLLCEREGDDVMDYFSTVVTLVLSYEVTSDLEQR